MDSPPPPPPPPPPGASSPPAGRFVRRQHQDGASPSASPGYAPLDATHRPPPPPPPEGGSPSHNPRNSIARHIHLLDDGTEAVPRPPPGPPSHPPSGEVSPSAGGRKLRALRRAGSEFSKLTSIPDRLQQWFDGCYSSRYHCTASIGSNGGGGGGHGTIGNSGASPGGACAFDGAAESPSRGSNHTTSRSTDPQLLSASLTLHGTLATFALRHCFDSPLFDVPAGGNTAASLKALSTTLANGGGGIDHSTKGLFDRWCEHFEECLSGVVMNSLGISDEELVATLEVDKKEEEGSGDANLFGAWSSTSPMHDFRAAIAPLASLIDQQQHRQQHGGIGGAGHSYHHSGVHNQKGTNSPSATPRQRANSLSAAAHDDVLSLGAAAAASASGVEKEHFYRWQDAIEFPAFVAEMRGVRALLARVMSPAVDPNTITGLGADAVLQLRSMVASINANAAAHLATDKAISDPLVRNSAHQTLKALTGQLRLQAAVMPAVSPSSSTSGLIPSPSEETLSTATAFYFVSPLLNFIRDQSIGARQAYRRKSALIPLMALWCPMGMDEDIWPTIQSLLSASGATIPGSANTFKIALEKKALKDLTLFRIRLSTAGKKAAAASAAELNAGVSPAVLSSPQYLLRPTASAVGTVAAAIDKTSEAVSASAADTSRSSGGSLDATDDLERDWIRFVSVFAESLDSQTFDKFIAFMYAVVLPAVILKDSDELVKLGLGDAAAHLLASAASPASPMTPARQSCSSTAIAFMSSVGSPLSGSSASAAASRNALAQAAVQAAARTVKRVFWMAFQQLDTYRKDKIPTPLLFDLIAATVEEVQHGQGAFGALIHNSSGCDDVGSLLVPNQSQSRQIPHQTLVNLAAIARSSAAKLSSYLKFTERDRAKLVIRLRNERKTAAMDNATANKFQVIGSASTSSPASLNTTQNGHSNSGGGKQTDPLGNSSVVSPTHSNADVSSYGGAAAAAGEDTVTLFQFVHILKDLVFDPLYAAAHPLSVGTTSASAAASPTLISTPAGLAAFAEAAAAEGRHMYWSELVAFVEVLVVVSNQPKFRQLLRKR